AEFDPPHRYGCATAVFPAAPAACLHHPEPAGAIAPTHLQSDPGVRWLRPDAPAAAATAAARLAYRPALATAPGPHRCPPATGQPRPRQESNNATSGL